MRSIIISGFAGVGKTFFYNKHKDKCIDSDSSKFDKKNFPMNYIEHIKQNIGKHKFIFVSCHEEVRKQLVKEEIYFCLVYPTKEQKQDYLKKYKKRKNDENFIQLMDKNWDKFIQSCKDQKNCMHMVLTKNLHLEDLLKLV